MNLPPRIAGLAGLLLALLSTFSLSAAETTPLRFGLLPDADSLPFLVADAEGLFAAQGLPVSLTIFKSPVERDAAFQAGAVDGIVGDVLGAAFAVDNGFRVAITSQTDGRYGLVAGPATGITSAAALAGQPIGTSTNTIIQYFIDTALTRGGVAPAEIKYLAVPNMPMRLEMVLNGQIKAAGLPEPLLTVARARGARLVAGSDSLTVAAGVVIFNKAYIDGHVADLARFYTAYAAAAQRINANNDAYRDFLVRKAGFPEEVRSAYQFVRYAGLRLPAPTELEAVLAWLQGRKLLKTALVPSAMVDGRSLAGLP